MQTRTGKAVAHLSVFTLYTVCPPSTTLSALVLVNVVKSSQSGPAQGPLEP